MSRLRADLLLVVRGLAESRAKARAAIEAGGVRADGVLVLRESRMGGTFELGRGPERGGRGGDRSGAHDEGRAGVERNRPGPRRKSRSLGVKSLGGP